MVKTAQDYGAPLKIIETVVAVNEARKLAMADRIVAALGGSVKGKTVAVLGLTFKPNTDDMRDSPSLGILPALLKAGATIRAFDPEGMDEAKKLMPDLTYCRDAYDCMTGADAVAIITEWNEFRGLDLVRMKQLLRQPNVVDLRNVYNPAEMVEARFPLQQHLASALEQQIGIGAPWHRIRIASTPPRSANRTSAASSGAPFPRGMPMPWGVASGPWFEAEAGGSQGPPSAMTGG